jgi:hypothetical protein
MENLSDEDQFLLIKLLNRCVPGKLNLEVFSAIARLTVSPAIEIVPLRKTENGIEVLLTERPAHDPIWASKLHTPGTILRPTDDNLSEGFKRIFNGELGIDAQTTNFVGVSFGRSIRGPGVGLEYWAELKTVPKIGKFYNIDTLPENYIIEQKGLLDRAVAAFRSHVI